MGKQTITLDVETFKEILIYSWHLLPMDKQAELASMGIYPKKQFAEENAPTIAAGRRM